MEIGQIGSSIELNESALLVASSPGIKKFGQAIALSQHIAPNLKIFGFDGQLRLFAEFVQRTGRQLFIAAAPEIFGSDESFQQLARVAGRDHPVSEIIHFRFGMINAARVLKNAKNIMVSAERHVRTEPLAAWHPFASGQILPASFRMILALHEQVTPLRRLDGSVIETCLLDLLADHPSSPSCQCPASQRRPGSPCILVPWNMSFAASMIPDLMVRLAGQIGVGRITLLPYNRLPEFEHMLDKLLDLVRKSAEQTGDKAFGHKIAVADFAPTETASLAKTFHLAWLEAADPEYHWTSARLTALNLPSAVIRTACATQTGGPHLFAVVADRGILSSSPNAPQFINTLSNSATQRLLLKSCRALERRIA